MQLLEQVHLVQFFLFEAQTLRLDPTTAIIAPNGAGKSALLDALQIVLLGGDRSRIRFNAQAGGNLRARTIRDYCLGVYRSGEDGRKRRTATTYISLVFRDQDSGEVLTAGIALGASVEESEHRVHGLYLAPGVALEKDEHLERVEGKELPLAWPAFRELLLKRCRAAGTQLELHSSSERFVKDLLYRLRAAPSAQPDVNAYRKAFQNALNLQKQEDIDLWVRTLVAEDRPTDVARFRGLLETFRQLKEKIEQVVRRIEAADGVGQQYAKISAQAVRAASYRALAAEYRRDLLSEQIDKAETDCAQAQTTLAATRRALQDAQLERQSAEDAHAQSLARLQGSQGYGEQAQLDALGERDREHLGRVRNTLQRDIAFVRDRLQELLHLHLQGVDEAALQAALHDWQHWHRQLQDQPLHAVLPWEAQALHQQAHATLTAIKPSIDALETRVRALHAARDSAQAKLDAARQNQQRLAAGQAELNPDAVRLLNYLREAGIDARPVCDLVRVSDPSWQPVIEAYLRSNVEALLIPQADEERATKLYRSLQGGRAVYGVKLALASHARHERAPASDSVAALLQGDNAEALGFLRRQLGELRCVETEAELVRSRQGLTRDGLLAKGGSIERLRLPATADLKIGTNDNRVRLRVLHDEIEVAQQELLALKPELQRLDACQRGMARLVNADDVAQALMQLAQDYRQTEQRYQQAQAQRSAALDPDLLQLSEHVHALQNQMQQWRQQVEMLIGKEALGARALDDANRLLQGLQAQEALTAKAAVDAFRHPDVDPNLVERQRDELDEKCDTLEDCIARCESREQDSREKLHRLVPDAWTLLQQYAKDHALQLEFESDAWPQAIALVNRELEWLRGTELVRYQGDAEQAYITAVETFRANVASSLYDNFTKLKAQIERLNRTLRNSPAFSNNERYRFHYEVVAEFRALHAFIQRAADVGEEDTLFGSAGEVPAAFRELIEDSVSARSGTSPLDDYRRFFRFEVQIRQEDRVIGTLSERMRSGSGGEHRAPLYVIAGAALAAAYGKNEANPGGLGVIMLDEFGDKIDAQNARATTNYLRSLGLQLVLAAPDTAQGTLSGILDSYIELFRDGDLLQAERMEMSEAARTLLLSDQFDLHPQLLEAETERIAAERAAS